MDRDLDSDAVESLRSLAAWMHVGPEPEINDRAAVRAWCDAIDKAAETLAELAGWDESLLRLAVGPVIDGEEEPFPGRWLLVGAALRAERRKEAPEAAAKRLAHSALLGAMVLSSGESIDDDDGADLRAGWVNTLAGQWTQNRRTALGMARQLVPTLAIGGHGAAGEVGLAQALLLEAEAACAPIIGGGER